MDVRSQLPVQNLIGLPAIWAIESNCSCLKLISQLMKLTSAAHSKPATIEIEFVKFSAKIFLPGLPL
jgi:hypothetical protein